MSIREQRNHAIDALVNRSREHVRNGVTVQSITRVKEELLELASRSKLFSRTDFPVPDKQTREEFLLIHEDENMEFALYLNSALPGQYYRPHDHGCSWAVIAAVEGKERHGLYRETGSGKINLIDEITVQPGTGVSILEGGIHSISGSGNEPLLHLHFYGRSFLAQGERREYDVERGCVEYLTFSKKDLDYIKDARI